MNEHEKTREYLINELKREIIGPEPIGKKIDLTETELKPKKKKLPKGYVE